MGFFCSAVTSQGLNYLTDYVWSRDAAALICSIEPTRKEIICFSFSPTPTHSLLPFAPGLLYSSCAFCRLAYRASAPAAWLFSVNPSPSSCRAVSLSGGSEGMFPYIMMRRRGGAEKLSSVHFWISCVSAEMWQGHAGLASSHRKRSFSNNRMSGNARGTREVYTLFSMLKACVLARQLKGRVSLEAANKRLNIAWLTIVFFS